MSNRFDWKALKAIAQEIEEQNCMRCGRYKNAHPLPDCPTFVLPQRNSAGLVAKIDSCVAPEQGKSRGQQ
jgi:hypothetical protein